MIQAKSGTVSAIQILRFWAAAIVLVSHIEQSIISFNAQYATNVHLWEIDGRLGVDIFFVISGYLMGLIAGEDFNKPGAANKFIFDRLTRIVPIYWLITFLRFAMVQSANFLGFPTTISWIPLQDLFKSFFFIPFLNEEGNHRPVLGQGWTLDYEIFFYCIFALCLQFRKTYGIVVMSATFVLLYAVGLFYKSSIILNVYSDPIIFEFLLGFYLSLLRKRFNFTLDIKGSSFAACVIVGMATYLNLYSNGSNVAIAMLLVVIAIYVTDSAASNPIGQALIGLGDASYCLYLTHGFVIYFVSVGWNMVFGEKMLYLYGFTVFLSAILLSLPVNKYIAVPATRALRNNQKRQSRAPEITFNFNSV